MSLLDPAGEPVEANDFVLPEVADEEAPSSPFGVGEEPVQFDPEQVLREAREATPLDPVEAWEKVAEAAGAGEPNPEADVNTPPQPGEIPEDAVVCETAFLVYLDQNGMWAGDSNYKKPVIAARDANWNDFFHGATHVLKDVNNSDISNRLMYMLQQQAQAAMQQQQAAEQLKSIIARGGAPGGPTGGVDLSKLRRG